jgi:hypothetical protein
MATIHIGEPAYYQRLNEAIADHDGLVLFEGLGQLAPEELATLTDAEKRVYESLAPLNEAYRSLAAALDLVAQPDALTKPGPNWMRADLPLRRLITLWADRRLPLIPALEAAGRSLDSGFAKRAVRFMLLQEPMILGLFRAVRGWSPALGRLSALLVDERNDAAITVFDQTPPEQSVLLIYGAGHVQGLLTALQRRGYREQARDWYTAHSERIAFTGLFDTATDWFRGARPQSNPGAVRRR